MGGIAKIYPAHFFAVISLTDFDLYFFDFSLHSISSAWPPADFSLKDRGRLASQHRKSWRHNYRPSKTWRLFGVGTFTNFGFCLP